VNNAQKQFIPQCLRRFCFVLFLRYITLFIEPHAFHIRSLANNFSKVEALDINQLIDLLIT